MDKGQFDRLREELEACERSPGLSMPDLLVLPEPLPEPLSGLLSWMVRQGQVSFADMSAFLGQDEISTRLLLDQLGEVGFVSEIELRDQVQYRVRLAPKRRRALPSDLWGALDEKVERDDEERY